MRAWPRQRLWQGLWKWHGIDDFGHDKLEDIPHTHVILCRGFKVVYLFMGSAFQSLCVRHLAGGRAIHFVADEHDNNGCIHFCFPDVPQPTDNALERCTACDVEHHKNCVTVTKKYSGHRPDAFQNRGGIPNPQFYGTKFVDQDVQYLDGHWRRGEVLKGFTHETAEQR